MTSLRLASVIVAVSLLAAPLVQAHDEKDPRHKAMTSLADNMKALAKMAKAGDMHHDQAVTHADEIAETARRMLALFPEGSAGHGSRAKPEIWTDWSGFEKEADDFERAVDSLRAAAQSGEHARLDAALADVGKTCSSCHKRFRLPKT